MALEVGEGDRVLRMVVEPLLQQRQVLLGGIVTGEVVLSCQMPNGVGCPDLSRALEVAFTESRKQLDHHIDRLVHPLRMPDS